MADNNTVARPYAQAVFELANDGGDLGAWSESLAIAGQLLADRPLVEYLGNPGFSDEQRLDFLSGLFKGSESDLLSLIQRDDFLKMTIILWRYEFIHQTFDIRLDDSRLG